MRITETSLSGAFLIEIEPAEDDRGFFARTFCKREFEQHGLNESVTQISVSLNKIKGTLRGMHYQVNPHRETKVVRCTRGAIYDVIIDLRPESRTFKQWIALQLTEHNRRMLYVPEGCAHGYETLEDNTEVLYQISTEFVEEAARGVRWDDPAFGVVWPTSKKVISAKDQTFPDFLL